MHLKAPPGLDEVLGHTPGETLKPVDQVLTLAEAVAAYTIGGAKMLGIEDEVGSIEVGKKADLILLDQNLFEIDPEEIPKTKVLGTMFDGKIVHDVLYGLGVRSMGVCYSESNMLGSGLYDVLDALAVDDEVLVGDVAEHHAQVVEGPHPVPSMLGVDEA